MPLIYLTDYELDLIQALLERELLGNGHWDPDKTAKEVILKRIKEARKRWIGVYSRG